MQPDVDIIIVGGGPMGIATAIEAKKENLTTLILEKGALVNSVFHFPKNMTFFSTSERLEIGDVPFMSIKEKPTRDEALEYYRRVVNHWKLNVHLYEGVNDIQKQNNTFYVNTDKTTYTAKHVVIATGFYSTPNLLNIPGESLPKVSHYYDEPHQYLHQKVAVIGAGNSACQVALELFHKGVDVTMIIRSKEIKPTVKYWIKPNIENRIKEGSVQAYFESEVKEIKEESIIVNTANKTIELENDFVLAMTGYLPDYDFLSKVGITNCEDEYDTPNYNDEQQTNIEGMYIAGVVCGGLKTNRFIIENSKHHAQAIVNDITQKQKLRQSLNQWMLTKLSADNLARAMQFFLPLPSQKVEERNEWTV